MPVMDLQKLTHGYFVYHQFAYIQIAFCWSLTHSELLLIFFRPIKLADEEYLGFINDLQQTVYQCTVTLRNYPCN